MQLHQLKIQKKRLQKWGSDNECIHHTLSLNKEKSTNVVEQKMLTHKINELLLLLEKKKCCAKLNHLTC